MEVSLVEDQRNVTPVIGGIYLAQVRLLPSHAGRPSGDGVVWGDWGSLTFVGLSPAACGNMWLEVLRVTVDDTVSSVMALILASEVSRTFHIPVYDPISRSAEQCFLF